MNMNEFGKVAVLFGGQSAERAVSLRSGQAVLEALRRRGIAAEPLDLTPALSTQLQDGGFARAFIVLHGRGGEDGCVQGVLETLGMPYTGTGVLGSALGMDKYRSKAVWQSQGIPTPSCQLLRTAQDLDAAAQLGFPLMVKPAREGSSIGISKIEQAADLPAAWEEARRFDSLVLAERFVHGGEYTCAILDGQALPCIKLETPRTFYDYEAKYHANTTRYLCPAGLDPALEAHIQTLAIEAFAALDGHGWGRVDLMLDNTGQPWFIEVNTVPGMTDHSLVPMAAAAAGMSFEDLVVRILSTTLAEMH